ncbi:hypothetical protein ACFE04_012013 [Oxalis oulophora]
MRILSGLGIGLLCLICVCLVLALVAEVYYLIWWRNKKSSVEIESIQVFCWKKAIPLDHQSDHINVDHNNIQDPEVGLINKDSIFINFDEDYSVEAELMRLHNLSGPSRFLFTIKEETNDDLESEDGKSIKNQFLLSPIPSPPLKISTLGFNPQLEYSSELLKSSSPPPKLKFLRDAEEKHLRKLLMEKEISHEEYSEPQNSLLAGIDVREDGHTKAVDVVPFARSRRSSTGRGGRGSGRGNFGERGRGGGGGRGRGGDYERRIDGGGGGG